MQHCETGESKNDCAFESKSFHRRLPSCDGISADETAICLTLLISDHYTLKGRASQLYSQLVCMVALVLLESVFVDECVSGRMQARVKEAPMPRSCANRKELRLAAKNAAEQK